MARPGLMDHRKFRRLVALLGVGPAQTRGHLEMLWDSAYQNGEAYIGDQTDVELAAGWLGEPGALCKVLVECGGVGPGFIDRRPDGATFEVHDLFDHAPEYVKSRWRMERKRREAGARVRKEKEAFVTVPNSSEQTEKGYASPAPAPAPAPAPLVQTSGAAAAAPAVGEPLDLKPLEPRPERPRFPKPGKKTNPDVKRLLDSAVAACQEFQGFKPVISGAPDAAAMATLLVGRSYDDALKLVREFYRDPPDWNREQGTLRLVNIPGAATKILARLHGNGKRASPGGEGRNFDDFKPDFVLGDDDEPTHPDSVADR
jgi:hypothetical protein